MAVDCEFDNESLGPIKCGEFFLTSLGPVGFSGRTLLPLICWLYLQALSIHAYGGVL